jgi:phosphopantetheinyl transferase
MIGRRQSQRVDMHPERVPNWRPGPARPIAQRGRIDVWRFRFSPEAGATMRAQAATALRAILARYLGRPAAELAIERGAAGKPYLKAPDCDLGFNLSHTRQVALLAVSSDAELGVDVECLRPVTDPMRIARRVMPPALLERLEATPDADLQRRFLECWTRFEAAQKAFGRGIFSPAIAEGSHQAFHFAVLPDCVASVAAVPPRPDLSLCFFDHVDS